MKTATWIVLGSFLMLTGCAYEANYRAYADAQARMSMMSGPLIELYEDGKIKSVGNPLVSVAQMQMAAPKSEAAEFFHWLTAATPFGIIWGVVGSMTSGMRGNTTNVTGENNLVGNTAGNQSQWASPTTTTITETTTTGIE